MWKDKLFTCQVCECEFTKENACATNMPKFCSRKCYFVSHKKKSYNCENCNKDFYPNNGGVNSKVCSKKCQYELMSKTESRLKGRERPNLYRAEIKKCRTCDCDFRAINDAINRKQVYCSHTCYVKGNRVSKFEDSVYEYLVEQNINLQRQVRQGRWSFDFLVKDMSIMIEADGSYWHSLPKQAERDVRKNEWCKKNNFEIYRIDELKFYKDKKSACQVIIERMLKLDSTLIVKKNGVITNEFQ